MRQKNFLIKDDMTADDRAELFGGLIDAVEDWLVEKGITVDDIQNEERGENNPALIYGSDYDRLADSFSTVLGISRDCVYDKVAKDTLILMKNPSNMTKVPDVKIDEPEMN